MLGGARARRTLKAERNLDGGHELCCHAGTGIQGSHVKRDFKIYLPDKRFLFLDLPENLHKDI